jgi:AcrR family transcriptional regulator
MNLSLHQISSIGSTHERILQAAIKQFAQLGYARTTMQGIATEAGVNEVTIFRHFGSKTKLFVAFVDRFAAIPDLTAVMASRLTGCYRTDLIMLGSILYELLQERREVVGICFSEINHFPEVRDIIAQIPKQLRCFLAGYLEQQINNGVVRDIRPTEMAQLFWNIFLADTLNSIFVGHESVGNRHEETVRKLVDVFINGTLNVKNNIKNF